MGILWRRARISPTPQQITNTARRLSQALIVLPHFPVAIRRSLTLTTVAPSAQEQARQHLMHQLSECVERLDRIGSTPMSGKQARETIIQALDLMERSAWQSLLDRHQLMAMPSRRRDRDRLLASTLRDSSTSVPRQFILAMRRKRHHFERKVRFPDWIPAVACKHAT